MSDTPEFMTHERIMTGEEYVSYSDYLSLQRERNEALHKLELCMAANSDVARIARERDEARQQNAKLRDLAERLYQLAMKNDVKWSFEEDGDSLAKIRAELNQLKEDAK